MNLRCFLIFIAAGCDFQNRVRAVCRQFLLSTSGHLPSAIDAKRPMTTANQRLPSSRSNMRDLSGWICCATSCKKIPHDLNQPHSFFLEDERSENGNIVRSGAILLTNKECPWRCVMCDLWKNTTTTSVPPGGHTTSNRFRLWTFGEAREWPRNKSNSITAEVSSIPQLFPRAITRRSPKKLRLRITSLWNPIRAWWGRGP